MTSATILKTLSPPSNQKMKKNITKVITFIQLLLGLSVWRITTTETGQKVIKSSKLGIVMLILNLLAVTNSIIGFEYYTRGLSTNQESILSNESIVAEIGSKLRVTVKMCRYYSVYFAVATLFLRQRKLFVYFLAADKRLKVLKDLIYENITRAHKRKLPWRYTLITARLVLVASTYWTIPFNRFLRAAVGCNFYSYSLHIPIIVLYYILTALAVYGTVFDILSTLAFVEARFGDIQQLLITLDKKNI